MPKKDQQPKSDETPFGRFQSTLKKLLQVPKKELDAKVAEDRAANKKRRPKN